ncbi:VOC family protein [Cryomorpha ignava]|uniref:VOC family protein n=1 Tax=Cryomorpha ignava TaxID=101383 RepID=A0A7K3WWI6_9FLAO|nr:VOC family protein [Cryomorpha ignava]NEN24975.1 VOC family protein [Cryomorpha ignava]
MIVALGGIFIYSENPKRLAEWYEKSLGLNYEYTEQSTAYYITFPYRETDSDHLRYTIFSILYNENRPLISDKSFTINLRVNNLEEMVEKLKSLKIEVLGIENHDEGKFAWVNDPEGNYIELWEDSAKA